MRLDFPCAVVATAANRRLVTRNQGGEAGLVELRVVRERIKRRELHRCYVAACIAHPGDELLRLHLMNSPYQMVWHSMGTRAASF